MLELERMLKTAKSSLTVYRAQELTKNMYAITYELPKSNLRDRVMLGMDEEQSELYGIVYPPKPWFGCPNAENRKIENL